MQRYAKIYVRKFFFSVRTVESWSKLPEDLKNAKNSSSFKNGLRQRSKYNEQRVTGYKKRDTKNTNEKSRISK
jgi:hypothetical protein